MSVVVLLPTGREGVGAGLFGLDASISDEPRELRNLLFDICEPYRPYYRSLCESFQIRSSCGIDKVPWATVPSGLKTLGLARMFH